jgi:hypothetical protein
MYKTLIMNWHSMRARYHEILIEDCLDEQIKQSLTQKLNYHKQKLTEYQKISA